MVYVDCNRIGEQNTHLPQATAPEPGRIAELCDFHPTYIGQLERGEKNATLESVSKLSHGLGISLNKLLDGVDSMDSSPDNIPLEIYHKLIKLPYDDQEKISSILTEILNLLTPSN